MIKEFSIASSLTIPITSNELPEVPSVTIKVKINDLIAYFTPFIYNKMMNIGKVLALDTNLAQMLSTNKKSIIDISVKKAAIFCYSTRDNIWRNYYVVLSGGYLYFYENEGQTFPLTYYYIENAIIKKLPMNCSTGIYEITVNVLKDNRLIIVQK